MIRRFPRPPTLRRLAPAAAVAALLGAAALAGCTPNNDVKPGAPVLTQLIVLQAGLPPVTITTSTPDCTSANPAGEACLPQGTSDADGGITTPDTVCHLPTAQSWCTCAAGMDPSMGNWSCDPFTATAGVIAIFDRLLSTAPFDAADGGPSTQVATLAAAGGAMTPLLADYAANGSTTGLIIPLYSQYVFNNFRFAGPSLLLTVDPELPSGATLTLTIDKTTVTAKDKKTSFTSAGLLQDGVITFKTAPFAATVTLPPPAPTPDGGPAPTPDGASLPDNTPATVAFTNFVKLDDVTPHITVSASGAPIPVTFASKDNLSVTITPTTTWPANATIEISVDQDTPDLLKEILAMPVVASFATTM